MFDVAALKGKSQSTYERWPADQHAASDSHLQSSSSDEITSLKAYKPPPTGFAEGTSDLWL